MQKCVPIIGSKTHNVAFVRGSVLPYHTLSLQLTFSKLLSHQYIAYLFHRKKTKEMWGGSSLNPFQRLNQQNSI